jgi:hypothetical protein
MRADCEAEAGSMMVQIQPRRGFVDVAILSRQNSESKSASRCILCIGTTTRP